MITARPSRRQFRVLAITALFAIDLVGSLFVVDRTTDCTVLNVVSSEEKYDALSALAGDWQTGLPVVDGSCVRVRVHRVASGAAEVALATGGLTDGVHADAWSPAAGSWTDLLRQRRAEAGLPDILPPDIPSIAQSPLVIGMPLVMAQAMGWPEARIGWSDIFDLAGDPRGWGRFQHPELGAFRLGKTNPQISTSGLHALVATYKAATHGLSGDLTPDDLAKPDVVDFVRRIEGSVVHYGPTVSEFTQNLQLVNDATYISAIAAEEQEVLEFNRRSTGIRLAAIYPADGTLMADHPFAVLDAPWVSRSKHDAGVSFLAYLRSPFAQAQIRARGFRDHDGVPGPVINRANLLNPARPSLIATPTPAVLELIQASWQQVRKKARVLLLIDVSSSMRTPNLDLVKGAAIAALDKFTADDEVGLWEFSGGLGTAGYRELVAIAPVGTSPPNLVQQIRSLGVRDGGTPLYRTLHAAEDAMRSEVDTGRINAILLLSVGYNEDAADNDRSALIRSLAAPGPGSAVRVFTIGYGRQPNADLLREIAVASHAAYYDGSDPALIGDIFVRVVSNF